MENYRCAMILSAVGDAMGYKNGEWEQNPSGCEMMKELDSFGGFGAISLEADTWPVSDDTIMHMATARALVEKGNSKKDELFSEMASCYVEAIESASARRPDPSYLEGCASLRPGRTMGWHVPFNRHGTGFGAASKAMCIGLVYWKPTQQKELIRIALESGRMTHNHPLGFTGSVCTALFTSFILQSKPIVTWGRSILSSFDIMKAYCKKTIRSNQEYREHWCYFETKWEIYLKQRGILNEGEDVVKFPPKYDMETRDKIYKSWSSEGRAGRRGHDAPMIAYDALMMAQQSSGNKWQELCYHAMIHGGESDSTGCIAGFWYGLMYGLEGIPQGHYDHIEFKEELEELAANLYETSR
ncbi:inactive ADP-ribosyltransferase ARH2-like [Ciona intestinalis]